MSSPGTYERRRLRKELALRRTQLFKSQRAMRDAAAVLQAELEERFNPEGSMRDALFILADALMPPPGTKRAPSGTPDST